MRLFSPKVLAVVRAIDEELGMDVVRLHDKHPIVEELCTSNSYLYIKPVALVTGDILCIELQWSFRYQKGRKGCF